MPDTTILERLQALSQKVDSPERLAMFQAFGQEHYADAEFLNLLLEALIAVFSSASGTVPTLDQVVAAGDKSNRDVFVINERKFWITNGIIGEGLPGRGVWGRYIDEYEMWASHVLEQVYSFKFNGKYVARSWNGIIADNQGNIKAGNSFIVSKHFDTPQTEFTLNELIGASTITQIIFNGAVESDPYINIPGFTVDFTTGEVTSGLPFQGNVSFITLI